MDINEKLRKMSKSNNSTMKKERGTTLTLEQYNIFVAFLKDFNKPSRKTLKNAGFAGNLSADQGKTKSNIAKVAYSRFKSIAKRLTYREYDNELIFKSNSKIVLPLTRYEEAIMEAHKSRGNKHLNLTKTIQKLGEKYTIGCRQFGITEENVRMVVRKCRDGSCAQRNKTEIEVMKQIANSENESSSKTSTNVANETSSTQVNQHDQKTASVIKVPLINSIPMTVVKLPNGTFGFQPSVNVPGFSSLNQLPVLGTKACTTSSQCKCPALSKALNSSSGTALTSMANVPKVVRMNLPISYTRTSSENKPFTSVQIPLQLITVGANPLTPGQQVCLVTTGSNIGNLLNTGHNSEQPIDLSKDSKISANQATSTVTSQDDSAEHDCKEDLSLLQDVLSKSFTAPYTPDQNNNETLSDGANNGGKSKKLVSAKQSGMSPSLDQVISDGSCGKDAVMDQTGTSEDQQQGAGVESQRHNKRYSKTLGPLPYPNIWYFYEDLSKQSNPYERISMCIKDMRLDLMRSIAGNVQATEKMKKKMHYIQELITTQQSVTQYLADFSSAMDVK